MKKAAVTGVRQAALVDAPTPQAKENWAVVKVQAAPMCTEYKAFVAGQPNEYLGHEAAGRGGGGGPAGPGQGGRPRGGDAHHALRQVRALRGRATISTASTWSISRALPGRARGTPPMRSTCSSRIGCCRAIPDGVSYEQASLACCALGPSFGAFDTHGPGRLRHRADHRRRAGGAGRGGQRPLPRRARAGGRDDPLAGGEGARRWARTVVIDPRDPGAAQQIKELTGGRGVDCSLDCSGTVAAQRLCIDATRRKGQVAFVGECSDELPIRVSPDMIRKGLTIIGSWHYNLSLFPQIMQVIQQSPVIDLLSATCCR